MKLELIKENLYAENGLIFQNLNEIDESKVIKDLSNKTDEIFPYKTEYWNYLLKQESNFNSSIGKWWFNKTKEQDETRLMLKCLESGLFEYCKNNDFVVCLYTTKENIQKSAKFLLKEVSLEIAKEIYYKFDYNTIHNIDESIYNLVEFL